MYISILMSVGALGASVSTQILQLYRLKHVAMRSRIMTAVHEPAGRSTPKQPHGRITVGVAR